MAKGKAYELGVADLVQQELSQGRFGIDPNLARVRHKPQYYSRDRKRNITFDVSVEVYRKGATDPFWLWLWECKNYGHLVPVDDVEEFHAKLSQVGADRTKGTMITPIGFDTGTIEFARSNGIGLWRWIPQDSPVCLMEDAREVADGDILRGLTTPGTADFRFYGYFYGLTCDGILTTDEMDLLKREFAQTG